MQSWPAGVYSIVKIDLVANRSKTRIVFEQASFMSDNLDWPAMYWKPLRRYLQTIGSAW